MAKSNLTVEIQSVTPTQAKEWLGRNGINRPLSQHRVNAISKDIERGRFVLNGETIIISGDGKLLNGQHRASAIVKANKPVETVVVYGVDEALMSTIDQGRARSHGDVFAIAGHRYPRLSATVSRYLWEYDNFGTIDTKIATTRANVIEWFTRLKDAVHHGVSLGERLKRSSDLPIVTVAVCDVLISRKSVRSTEFFESLANQAPTPKESDNPLGALRRYLTAPRRSNQSARLIPLTIKTWNAWVKGEPMSVATFRAGEPFPEIET